jgi:hypothetical protein
MTEQHEEIFAEIEQEEKELIEQLRGLAEEANRLADAHWNGRSTARGVSDFGMTRIAYLTTSIKVKRQLLARLGIQKGNPR